MIQTRVIHAIIPRCDNNASVKSRAMDCKGSLEVIEKLSSRPLMHEVAHDQTISRDRTFYTI